VERILYGRIKNRPRSHQAIRRRFGLTFLTQTSFANGDSAFFTERLRDKRDASLAIRAPTRPCFSTASTHRREEQVQPAPGQSI
jgi:hypothetical protein